MNAQSLPQLLGQLQALLPISVQTITLLVASNLFMTVAWYGHLKHPTQSPTGS